ncbi:MAG: hypothetical protein GY827_11240 [Cytophagales bacterium]|nr:hypothetical protein [Cytophagales bacterium]
MKLKIVFITLIGLLFLTGCKNETSEILTSSSADGQITVTVQGSRMVALDPWKADITMTVKEKTQTASIEVQADELSEKNVKFTWKSKNECIVTFTLRDGQTINVPISVQGL